MGPLASCLNKESDHSFILKEVYPDKAHSVKPLVCFQARDEWVNIAVTLQGQTLYFHESLRKSQYSLLKYDRDYLKVTLDSTNVYLQMLLPFSKVTQHLHQLSVPQLQQTFHLHNWSSGYQSQKPFHWINWYLYMSIHITWRMKDSIR